MILLLAAFIFYLVAAIGTCALALVRGGRDERAVAIGYLIAALASTIVAMAGTANYRAPEYGVMAVDVLFFGFLMVIVARTRSFWPLWAAGAQLVGTVTHLAKVMQPSMAMEAYATVQPLWAFPLLISLAIGTLGPTKSA